MFLAKMRMWAIGFARTSRWRRKVLNVSCCTSRSRQIATNRSRRLSLEYQKRQRTV